MRLVGRALIGITWRYSDAVQAEPRHLVEEIRDAFGLGRIEQRAVDADAEALRFRQFDRIDSLVVDTLPANRVIVHPFVAVEMNRPVEVRMRPVLVDLLGEEKRIGA